MIDHPTSSVWGSHPLGSIRLFPTSMLVALSFCSAAMAHVHGPVQGLEFHLNQGQWPQAVLYRANTPGGALFIEADRFTQVIRSGGWPSVHGRAVVEIPPIRMHAYQVRFVGGAMRRHRGAHQAPHYYNYFLGNDPTRWASQVPAFGEVTLEEVYPGIDLQVSGDHGLKYDWVVDPGADPSAIALRFDGVDGLDLEGGVLRIKTSAGDVIEQRPVAWQERGGLRIPVPIAYALKGRTLSYALPQGHDPQFPLIIDPEVVFCSFSGSSAPNYGTTATYDESGHLYGAGTVFGIGYPVTLGVIQSGFNGFESDMGISKFSPDGADLVWCTYLGGASSDVPHSMVVNAQDELFILGSSASSDFPTTDGCYDDSFGGGPPPAFGGTYGVSYPTGSDIVVAHLNATATALVGATFVGGPANDGLCADTPLLHNYGDPFRGEIIIGANGAPIVATSTSSTGLFTSPEASQADLAGLSDAYLFSLDPALATMNWATYHGGTGRDVGFGVQTASTGEVYLTGGTQSIDLPMAGTPYAPVNSGGVDGYIARFSPSSAALTGATYLGTAAFDQSYFVQLDLLDNVYVVGQSAGNFPVVGSVYNNPSATQFIQKYDAGLSFLQWSTRIGGTGSENVAPSAFLVSNCGQIYFSGWGGSTNFVSGGVTSSSTFGLPVTTDAYQPGTDGSDFYLMVLQPDAAGLDYATFFGGSSAEHVDGGTSRFDKDGIIYQAVCAACSGSFPTTPGAFSTTLASSNCNLGVFKINFEQGVQAFINVDATSMIACTGTPFQFEADGNAVTYTWDFGDGSAEVEGVAVEHLYSSVGTFNVRLIGTDPAACNLSDTTFTTVTVVEPAVIAAEFEATPNTSCAGYSAAFVNQSTGTTQFFWDLGDGTTSTMEDPMHTFALPGSYTVVLAAIDPVCADTTFARSTIRFDPAELVFELATPVGLCDGQPTQLDAGAGFDAYAWSTGATTRFITVPEPGEYLVTVTDGICQGADTVVVIPAPLHEPLADVVTCVANAVQVIPGFQVQQILWSNGTTTPTLTVNTQGTYWFNATDATGCAVSDTVQVTIAEDGRGEATIPNVFTPNGDGQNDTFQVEGLAIDDFNMEIYDRWGLLMYETNAPLKGWNGGKDNSLADRDPDGTYYYVITMSDRCARDPAPRTHTGHVTLLR